MYKVEYLPVATGDMINIVQYISTELNNPAAAERIAEKLIAAGEALSDFPYSNPSYIPLRPLQHEYRKKTVGNYIILYFVNEERKIVTIARVVYCKRDYEGLLPQGESK